MARKTSKDLRKEYNDKLTKLSALEARIKARALEMCKAQPDVPIGRGAIGREIEKFDFNTRGYIDVIQYIEDINEKNSKHVQTTIPYNS